MPIQLGNTVAALSTTLTLTVVVFSLLWLIHVRIRDAGIVDYWWGLGFAAIAWTAVAFTDGLSPLQLFVTAAVTFWAVRLTAHMAWRHQAKGRVEDRRYAEMRARGGPNWWRTNLVTVFWLQALLQWVLAAPILALILRPATPLSSAETALAVIGLVLFAIGFAVEVVADAQLARFSADPANKGRLYTGGLFAWSRHPNYFGEALLWWGLSIAASAGSGAWWTLAAPAALTLLLLRVSGLPLLEPHLARRPGWAAYAARTPAFLPRPPATDRRESLRERAE